MTPVAESADARLADQLPRFPRLPDAAVVRDPHDLRALVVDDDAALPSAARFRSARLLVSRAGFLERRDGVRLIADDQFHDPVSSVLEQFLPVERDPDARVARVGKLDDLVASLCVRAPLPPGRVATSVVLD